MGTEQFDNADKESSKDNEDYFSDNANLDNISIVENDSKSFDSTLLGKHFSPLEKELIGLQLLETREGQKDLQARIYNLKTTEVHLKKLKDMLDSGLSQKKIKHNSEQGGWTNIIEHDSAVRSIQNVGRYMGFSQLESVLFSTSIMAGKEVFFDKNITNDDIPIPLSFNLDIGRLELTITLAGTVMAKLYKNFN